MLRNLIIVALAVALCWPEPDTCYRAFRETTEPPTWEHLGEWERKTQIPARLIGCPGVVIVKETRVQ